MLATRWRNQAPLEYCLMVPSGVTVLPTNLPPTGSSSVMF
jgi:hypothetical protein